MKAPRIEEDYTSYFPKYGYRNGGRPEGIVVHDTANDNSTIDGEIAFMNVITQMHSYTHLLMAIEL